MTAKEIIESRMHQQKRPTEYEYTPPDGGYGYIIVLGLFIIFITVFVPNTCFGLVFGPFLANFADETTATTTVNAVFNTVFHSAGLISNPLLQKVSYRKIAFVGAAMIASANIATIFCFSVEYLIVTFGILQGLGVGLLVPATMSSFNEYFDKRKDFMMGVCQTAVVGVTIFWPTLTKFLLEQFGFRGTVAIFAAISAHDLFTAVSMQPVRWHMKRIPIEDVERKDGQGLKDFTKVPNEREEDKSAKEVDQLLTNPSESNHNEHEGHHKSRKHLTRPSIISIGSVAISVKQQKTQESLWKSIINVLDIEILKDPFYHNLVIGVSLALVSELNFIAVLPAYLTKRNFSKQDVAMVMATYFASDLVFRICLTLVMAFISVRNRYLLFGSTILAPLFRIAFTLRTGFWWVAVTCGCLGALRGLIHIPLALAIAEEYPEKFSSAFTLYMVICGIVSFILGQIMNIVKILTDSDTMAVHVLTVTFMVVAIAWILEFLYKRAKGIKPPPKGNTAGAAH